MKIGRVIGMNRGVIILSLIFADTNHASACAVCFGDPLSPLTQGLNWAIGTLLSVAGGVLISFAIFFLQLRTKAKSPGLMKNPYREFPKNAWLTD